MTIQSVFANPVTYGIQHEGILGTSRIMNPRCVSMFMCITMYVSIYVILCMYRCVCISLEAADDTDVVLALSYVVSSASWSPQYDLRVFSSDKTMKVTIYN